MCDPSSSTARSAMNPRRRALEFSPSAIIAKPRSRPRVNILIVYLISKGGRKDEK